MMKRILLVQILLLITGFVVAQNSLGGLGNRFSNMSGGMGSGNMGNNSSKSDTSKVNIPPKLYMWHLDENLGTVLRMPADTLEYNFQNSNLTEGMTGHYNYLGNLGAPRQSRIFFERNQYTAPNILIEPYSAFVIRPGNFKFTNSNIPYTNLSYFKGGSKEYGEERFKSYFSVNVNKDFAFGFNIDYLYGRGFYNNQSTSFFNGALFGSYMGDHYEASLIYSNNYLKMNENGGITDDRYITNPEDMSAGGKNYEAQNIPTNLDASNNRNHDSYVFLAHRYKLGFRKVVKVIKAEEKEKLNKGMNKNLKLPGGKPLPELSPQEQGKQQPEAKKPDMQKPGTPLAGMHKKPGITLPKDTLNAKNKNKKDSVVTEFIPVTSFIHTMKYEHTFHHYYSTDGATYTNTYIKPSETAINDTTEYTSLKNTFGIALLEGFNKYAKAGLTAYISHKMSRYKLMDADSTSIDRYKEQEVYIGGELAKRQGKSLHYVINGEAGLLEKATGQFRLNGNVDFNFHFLRDTVSIIGRASISNTLPDFYMRHFHSKHFYWDNDLSKEFRSHIEGELSIEKLQTHLKVGVENIKNYTYFDANATSEQKDGNIQVMSATLNQNFRLGFLHLDNEVIWQKSSDKDILPLPSLSLYHNLYILAKLSKKVLNVQLGADVRYFSKYYAPAYTPDIQQFHLQGTTNRVELGAYPIINLYANLQLKHTRFFAMFYHINEGMGNSMYFLVPHYPINQRLFKIGLSWNFYD
jgi:hypothetical protein